MKAARYTAFFLVSMAAFPTFPVRAKKADKPKITQPDKTVQLRSDSSTISWSAPLVTLSGALKKDVTSQRFRVTWHFVSFESGAKTTALYDREKHTLKLYSDHYNENGDRIRRYLLSSVSDSAIHKLTEEYQDDEGEHGPETDELAFFTRLTEFGAQLKTIEDRLHL